MKYEIFKTIFNYPDYEVSNLGRVKSLKYNKERILSSSSCGKGYLKVCLCKNKINKTVIVHHLVAIAFLNHKPNGNALVVNHINFDKSDNRLENLELITQRENSNRKHLKSSSEYVGVCWHKNHKKWSAQITINKKQKHLGYFTNEYDAHLSYQGYVTTFNTL